MSTATAAPAPYKTPRFERTKALLRSPTFVVGALILLFWVGCALVGHWLVPQDPYASDPLNSLTPPDATHWFGTDQLGRDVFARVIDAVLALSLVIVALLALAAVGASNTTVILVIGITFTPITARTVRAAVFAERNLDYVLAAQLRGENAFYIMFAEILPNVLQPIIVEATVRLGYAIFSVATLSFLGFGIQPPSADWGLTLSECYTLMAGGAWWTVVFDAAAIASLVVGVNLVADGIQGVLER